MQGCQTSIECALAGRVVKWVYMLSSWNNIKRRAPMWKIIGYKTNFCVIVISKYSQVTLKTHSHSLQSALEMKFAAAVWKYPISAETQWPILFCAADCGKCDWDFLSRVKFALGSAVFSVLWLTRRTFLLSPVVPKPFGLVLGLFLLPITIRDALLFHHRVRRTGFVLKCAFKRAISASRHHAVQSYFRRIWM